MYEMEMLKRATTYISKLANGIDPLTDTVLPSDTIMNNIRISRCLFYVSDVLSKVIENGGEVYRKPQSQKIKFDITAEQLKKVKTSTNLVSISEFCRRIDAAAENENMKKLSTPTITNWLLHKNILRVVLDENGKNKRLATEKGFEIGISEKLCEGKDGNYTILLYDEQAQKFILDNFLEMLAWQKSPVKTENNEDLNINYKIELTE